jgi:hypothetical protein
MRKKRPVVSAEYRLLRELAEQFDAEDVSTSDRSAHFHGFKSVQDKQTFAEKAARIVGPDSVSSFQGQIFVDIVKFIDPNGTTKRIRKG